MPSAVSFGAARPVAALVTPKAKTGSTNNIQFEGSGGRKADKANSRNLGFCSIAGIALVAIAAIALARTFFGGKSESEEPEPAGDS